MDQNLETVTDLALEQYRLDELPRAHAERVQRALDTEPSLRARLAMLAQSDEVIAREYPPAWLASQIRARAARRGTTVLPRRPVAGWAWPLGLATAVLALLFTLPGSVIGPNLSTTVSTTEDSRPKGIRPALAVYRRTDRGSETMADGAIARAGDLLRLGYPHVTQAYGVILSVDGRGTVTRHLPANGARAALLGHDRVNLLNAAYELDDAPGWERFYFVTADTAFDVEPVVAAVRQLAARDLQRPPALLPLGPEFSQAMFLLQKEARQ
jgi:anti-sigma factor RsiW